MQLPDCGPTNRVSTTGASLARQVQMQLA